MPPPGSSHALVLPSTAVVTDEEDEAPGKRLPGLLEAFLDPKKYAALAVVHGLGERAPGAFDLAKRRRPRSGGVVWVPVAAILDELEGPNAELLAELFAPEEGDLVTFLSVKNRTVITRIPQTRLLRSSLMDLGYKDATLG